MHRSSLEFTIQFQIKSVYLQKQFLGEKVSFLSPLTLSGCNLNQVYGKCSKISNTHCLPKRQRKQTTQTQIRLKKQSDQGLPCLLSRQAFYLRVEKVFETLELLPLIFVLANRNNL